MSEAEEVTVRIEGGAGRFTLYRPGALNALTLAMCHAMSAALHAWRADPAVKVLLIDHAGERGFCAGGDIRNLAAGHAGDGSPPKNFFFHEYRLDHQLFTYDKPVASFMDGVVMGGGVGVAMPARYRIATERTTFAMPETGIGLFPDIGAGWFLARLPGEIGTWLALTGARIKAADCLYLNLCSHYVVSDRIEGLKKALLANPDEAKRILARFSDDPGLAPLSGKQSALDRVFEHDTVEQIMAALEVGSSWAQEQATILKTKSPTSMKVALRELRASKEKPNFADEMALEYRLGCRMITQHDFQEGVRAVVIDKDNAPQWSPARLEDVTEAMLDALFAPFEDQPEFTPID